LRKIDNLGHKTDCILMHEVASKRKGDFLFVRQDRKRAKGAMFSELRPEGGHKMFFISSGLCVFVSMGLCLSDWQVVKARKILQSQHKYALNISFVAGTVLRIGTQRRHRSGP
jgi:hypothetical protein